jgi:hypothetical protein
VLAANQRIDGENNDCMFLTDGSYVPIDEASRSGDKPLLLGVGLRYFYRQKS